MKIKVNYLFLMVSFLSISLQVLAQIPDRKFEKIENSGDKIKVFVSDGVYEIVPFTNNTVHTSFFPKNIEVKNFSYAVAVEPEKLEYKIKETSIQVEIVLKNLKIRITKKPFQISYVDLMGNLLISENKGYTKLQTGSSLDFKVTKDEIFYGGGARVLGMNRRGNKLQLYNRAHYSYETRSELMNYTLPIFISSKKYAVLFDNAASGYLDLDSKNVNSVSYQAVNGTMNYYVIYNNSWKGLIKEYTGLTGRQPLPPRWVFGNFSSRFGYHSQNEVEMMVDKFAKDSILLDALIIDIYWFGKNVQGDMGNLDWYRDSFPDPEKMIARIKEKGVKTVLVTEPFILTTSKKWKEVVDKKLVGLDSLGNPYKFDFYFGNTGLIDLYKPEAREWFWDIYKNLAKQGVAGWWGDLGEPEVHPSGLQHAVGSADDIHNAYGHEWAKLIFEGYRKDFPETRPFILMRSGYAGSQRYGMIPWSGDVGRSWGGLMGQPEISMQMGMQGIAYMHSDLGGFAGGLAFNPELYTRWLQYGVFQPIYRPHAQEQTPSEPVFQDSQTKSLAKKSIELRYKLIPYIYNLAFENSQSGMPLMIPLFFVEPDNKNLLTYDQAYMWGDAFLVSPVKEKGKKIQDVYFPKGSNWYDFFGNTKYSGGKTVPISLKLENIPVFVKGGSFIPMNSKLGNTENYSLDKFELHYFVDPLKAKSTYRLYNDDGKMPEAFSKAQFEFMHFEALNNAAKLQIRFTKDLLSNSAFSPENEIAIKIHHLAAKPKLISINGKALKSEEWKWSGTDKLLELIVTCNANKGLLEIVK